MAKKQQPPRTRHWGFIAYPTSVREDWLSILSQLGIQAAISPLHDKDVTQDGTLKKPHWHVCLCFDSVKSQEQIQEITQAIVKEGEKGYLPVRILSLRGTLRYFIHVDDPDKAQYSADDVQTIGGLDYVRLCQTKNDEEGEIVVGMAALIQYISDHADEHLFEFGMLADMLIRDNMSEGFSALRKNSYFFGQYLKSKKIYNKPLDNEKTID